MRVPARRPTGPQARQSLSTRLGMPPTEEPPEDLTGLDLDALVPDDEPPPDPSDFGWLDAPELP